MWLELLITLGERMAVIAVIAYLLSSTKIMRNLVYRVASIRDKIKVILVFGLISISGTYIGIFLEFTAYGADYAFANVRDMGAVVAGMLGGPLVGLGAGLIGGVHRMLLGGFTAIPCGLGTVLGGLVGGAVYRMASMKSIEAITSFLVGMGVEIMNMGLILLITKPFNLAWTVVQTVGIPMITINGLGITVFMMIIHNMRLEEERIGAAQAQKTLKIADQTLPYLRKGLNVESAASVAKIILDMTKASAVSITDTQHALAHVGLGSDHHYAGLPILTEATKRVLASGNWEVIQTKNEIGCPHKLCPLHSAVIVPLKCKDAIIGTLKLYKAQENEITPVDIEFSVGVAKLFATQIELAEAEKQAQLKTKAELRLLQAQINPHFLFNALNTVVSFCRTNPEQARDLLLNLSDFFRQTLGKADDFVPLAEEIEHINAYFSIEKARFGERLTLAYDLDPETLTVKLPNLLLQPLVENAIKHGLLSKSEGGTVTVSVKQKERALAITISDNGIGIPSGELPKILQEGYGTGAGIGLKNVNERLKSIYGPEYALRIESLEGIGTKVFLTIPASLPYAGGVVA